MHEGASEKSDAPSCFQRARRSMVGVMAVRNAGCANGRRACCDGNPNPSTSRGTSTRRALCNPGSRPETGTQGRVSRARSLLSSHESLVLSEKRGLLAAVLGDPAFYPGAVDVYDVSGDCRHSETRRAGKRIPAHRELRG